MPLQIDGTTVGEVRYARPDGSLATVGEARVWDSGAWRTVYTSWKPRIVTINTTSSGWNNRSDSGDTDLISSLIASTVSFRADVVCDKEVRAGAANVSPGDRIAAGQGVSAQAPFRNGDTYTFTEVR